jgi:hypothetical protein
MPYRIKDEKIIAKMSKALRIKKMEEKWYLKHI